MKITHEQYFRNYGLSAEQYGEILAAVAYRGTKMPDHFKGYDVKASIEGADARIEVKTKFAKTETGKATVVNCSASKFRRDGMTHIVLILLGKREDKGSDSVKEAWKLTRDEADGLRSKHTKSKYINVARVRKRKGKGQGQLLERLQAAARSPA